MDRPDETGGRRSGSSPFLHQDRGRTSRPRGEADEEAFPQEHATPLPERAASVLKRIGDEFNVRREANRTAAFSWLQHELWANVDVLVPYALTFEKLIDKSIHLEDFVKNDSGAIAEEPLEVFRKFLSAPEIEKVPPPGKAN